MPNVAVVSAATSLGYNDVSALPPPRGQLSSGLALGTSREVALDFVLLAVAS